MGEIMQNKFRIGFDFDGVIGNTILAIIELYKEKYPNIIKHDYPIPENVTKWNFSDVLIIQEHELENYFASERLFELMTFFSDANISMKSLLNELLQDSDFEVYIATKGNYENLRLKREWLTERLPMFNLNNFIGIPLETQGKPYIKFDMFIDDVDSNFNGKSKYNVLFMNQGIKDWNRRGMSDDKLIKITSVTELANKIFETFTFEKGILG